MIRITQFHGELISLLPETFFILQWSNLVVHEDITKIILHGSRGLAGKACPDSDMDVSVIVDRAKVTSTSNIESYLKEIFDTTLVNWRSSVELDLAVVFDSQACGLTCFEQDAWNGTFCTHGNGADCFGLYKTQKGFRGLVTNAGVVVARMHPCLKIWDREM